MSLAGEMVLLSLSVFENMSTWHSTCISLHTFFVRASLSYKRICIRVHSTLVFLVVCADVIVYEFIKAG